MDRFGAAAKPALPALKKAVGDNDKFIRVIAMHALGRMGPDLGDEVKDVVAVLLPHLNDQILEVRVAAIQALGAIGREALGEDLKKVTARLSAQADDSRAAVRDACPATTPKRITASDSVIVGCACAARKALASRVASASSRCNPSSCGCSAAALLRRARASG